MTSEAKGPGWVDLEVAAYDRGHVSGVQIGIAKERLKTAAAIDAAVQAAKERIRKLIEDRVKGLERRRTTFPTRRGGVPDNTRGDIKIAALQDLLAALSPDPPTQGEGCKYCDAPALDVVHGFGGGRHAFDPPTQGDE